MFTSRGRGGGERHRELSAEELQPLLLQGQGFNLLLQPPVLLLQLVEGLQHGHHYRTEPELQELQTEVEARNTKPGRSCSIHTGPFIQRLIRWLQRWSDQNQPHNSDPGFLYELRLKDYNNPTPPDEQ